MSKYTKVDDEVTYDLLPILNDILKLDDTCEFDNLKTFEEIINKNEKMFVNFEENFYYITPQFKKKTNIFHIETKDRFKKKDLFYMRMIKSVANGEMGDYNTDYVGFNKKYFNLYPFIKFVENKFENKTFYIKIENDIYDYNNNDDIIELIESCKNNKYILFVSEEYEKYLVEELKKTI